ncbi:mucin-5AC [Sitodiplosis mosellana]|uniref:mucin-5AC n=1 Tax=Sitodiplosis mosellana TaxID=263140 RepID=UPI0024449310|nr:mucin-5AC [Sitodiplosis mosellana]XP_055323375.1 mucin-5AC [Sitodiplosis mosellana]XP_055323376.1 mucin-5AC [Sitodiplosis mosellana]XP_055323377.1 mucin-5AC [Sitodiplosis mosellana]XP_055323378.1 mucin-5AC [Sitodiplosis mosellana]XP_055323379.1 mucin-5AC [Sitodiplosis mosellana]XP_055323380.1 mucin-5AC [Sitodiplosis mosellana]
MLKGSVALNESSGENDSVLLPSTTTIANQIESIVSNMEETSAAQSTHIASKSNNCQNENESDASSGCERITAAAAAAMSTESQQPSTTDTQTTNEKNNDETTTTTSNSSSADQTKNKKAVHLLSATAPNMETICDDISSTTEDIKRLKHVQVRSNSTGKLYQSSRRVSFPENNLVTGYLEPADPWAYVKPATCVSELAEFYRESCRRHNAQPIESIMKHLDTLDLNSNSRRPVLNLREQNLTAESCEALEEVLKRIQYKLIDLTDCGLNDASATALFDIIEYYEAANEIDISENRNITNRGWQACINMVKRSHALQILVTRGTPLSESNAISLGKSMLSSSLNTLKLEHCGLSGRPMASLCTYLRKNTVLKELWLAHNDLTADDAYNIGNVLKSNFYLQFLDLSNNNIQDPGVLHIADALIEQANYFKVLHGGSSSTASQPLSSKHTLTRGDKNESKYECLARLINAAKPNADGTPKPDAPNNFIALVTAEKSTAAANTTGDDRNQKEADEKTEAQGVTKPAKSDNNNTTVKAASDSTAATPSPAPAQAAEAGNQSVCELKIVEQIEQNSKESKSDNDDDSSLATSNSTTSFDLSEKNSVDANVKHKVEDNNNGGAADVKHTEKGTVLSNSEQSTEIVSQQQQQQQTTQPPKEDLTETSDDAQPDAMLLATSNDCHLDINENKSDMKLNYAEVVKVENALESTLCENKNFNVAAAEENSDHVDNKKFDSTRNVSSDLDDKVQSTDASATRENTTPVNVAPSKRKVGCSSPKPIQTTNLNRHDDPDEEMSPVCKVRLPLNSPRLTKSKDIMSELPLTPDSSHSLDSSCEYSTYNTSIVPERSFSSESLNSETSIESNDSKSSIKLAEVKFSKNGTLERQSNTTVTFVPSITTPNGLQVLMLWNNHITRDSAQSISKLLAATTTLEILNVGKNVLSNDFVANIKASLKANTSLTSLGLQSVHLSNDGVKTLSEILDFGGNVTLQRVDLRDNNLQVSGLTSLNEVLKSNKSITRIDLDDVPRRAYEHSSDSSIDYNRVVNNIRSLCARNENPPDPEPVRTSVKRVRASFLNSRKISLTCQSIRNSAPHDSPQAKADRHLLDPTRKSGRLRSPSPSPIPSPVSSPIPSPSRSSRFQVSRVVESNVSSPITPPSSNSCSPTSTSSSSRFRVTVVEPPKVMSAPVTIINSTNKECDKSVQKKEVESVTASPTTTMKVVAAVPPLPLPNVLQRTQSAPSTTMSAQAKEEPPTSAIETSSTKDSKVFTVSKPTDHQQQHIATTLTVIDNPGNSFDSPDLEVKSYMDDSCSSFSSLDSIDRGQDFNTSFSSMESYDMLRENKFATDNLGKNVYKPKQNVVTKNLSNSSIETENETVELNKADNNPSSLEASTCSNDSIYGSQEFPVLKISSNEGTLTNSPVSPCSGDIAANEKDSLSPKPDDKQQRVRKTSWISRGDAVPATLDKLLSIFHHPSNLFFTRSSNGDVPKQQQTQGQDCNKPPSRKESPSGLFAWSKKENVFDEVGDSKPSSGSGGGFGIGTGNDVVAQQKTAKSPLQSNMSPENTITADSVGIEAIPIQLKQDVKENVSPEHTVTADSMANLQLKSIATQTASTDVGPKAEKIPMDMEQQQQVLKNEKVHFEVGGDDDEDEYDETNKIEYAGVQVNTSEGSHQHHHHQSNATIAANHMGKAFGLGQITRDSLSILKGSSNNSQDSMRSLESLSEIVFEEK